MLLFVTIQRMTKSIFSFAANFFRRKLNVLKMRRNIFKLFKKRMNPLTAALNIFKFFQKEKTLSFLAFLGVILILSGIVLGFITIMKTEKLDPMLRVNSLLNQMSEFSKIKCSEIFDGNKFESEKAKKWKFPDFEFIWKQIEDSENKCQAFKNLFVFIEHPLTEEEAEFPLAYGALVYKDVTQVAFMLSSIYRPNNVYVFMVDLKADKKLKERISLFERCFTNVFVKVTDNNVEHAGYEITRAVFQSVGILVESKYDWKYFQYLTGFDLPLKTNLEMVRIFKELNGTFNVEIAQFEDYRLNLETNTRAPKKAEDSPLPLFKSSLSATFSRESAEFMVKSKKVEEVVKFLEGTYVSDESIWGTFAGNPDLLPIPGGVNGSVMLKRGGKLNNYLNPNETSSNNTSTFYPTEYYISRYQIWIGDPCKGKFVSGSCVFGVADLPVLITRPELVVHKMYLDFEPAAYFCLYQYQWQQTLNFKDQQNFNAESYRNIAAVNNLSFYYV